MKAIPLEGRLRDIVEESARLFDRHGYTNVSMEQIASAVGLAKPTLYHYVKSKDDILVLVHEEFMRLAREAANSPDRSGLSAREQLTGIMIDIMVLMHTHRGHVRVFFEHYRELPRDAQKSIREERRGYESIVQGILSAGVSSGEFRPMDVSLAALAVFGMCNWAYQWYDPSGKLKPEAIARRFADFVLTGISVPKGRRNLASKDGVTRLGRSMRARPDERTGVSVSARR